MPVGVRHGNTKKVVLAEFTALQNEGSKSPQLTSEKKTKWPSALFQQVQRQVFPTFF